MVIKLPGFQRPRIVQFESMLEYCFLCLMAVRTDVFSILEQPSPIPYRRADGTTGNHTFDFLVVFLDGKRIAVAIKPEDRALHRGFVHELKFVEAATPKHFADRIMLVTDKHLDRRAAAEAARHLMRNRPALTEVAA